MFNANKDSSSRELTQENPPSQYRHPGKIINKDLCTNTEHANLKDRLSSEGIFQVIRLKEDLIEHHDYEAVTVEVWRYLSSWYSYDVLIPRFLAYDSRTGKTYLDLYQSGI